jgi:hypothetical protein
MPVARFEMPDGKIGRFEVPEGTTPEQAQSLIAESLNPQQTTPKPQSRMEAALEALRNPIGVEGKTRVVGPMLMGGLGETIKGAGAASQLLPESVISPKTSQNIINVGRAMTEGASKEFPKATGAGQIGSYLIPAMELQKGLNVATNAAKEIPAAANIIGKIPSYATAMGQQAAIGGATSALTTPTDEGRGQATAIGAGLGALGIPVMAGASRVLSPIMTPDVKKMIAEKISMTPGQIMGGMLKSFEDKATSLPIVGEAINAARRKGIEDFNRAAYKRVTEPIGGEVPIATGREGINYLKNQLEDSYDALLPKLTFNPDKILFDSINNLNESVKGLSKKDAKGVTDNVKSLIQSRLPNQGGSSGIDGNNYKIIEEDLKKIIGDYKGSTGSEATIGRAYQQALADIRESLGRNNPQFADELAKINTGYANYARIRGAGSRAGTSETFTPNQLSAAVRSADKSAGKGETATGKALMQDLTDAAERVLPSQIKDSGTASRLMATDLKDWLYGMATAAPYMPGGRQITQALLTQRPETAKELAKLLKIPQVGTSALIGTQRMKAGENNE